jgi:cytidine deaminase
MKYQRLYDQAKKAYQNAYAPYSKFHVGAALKLKDGTVITGSNIENASFGLTNCAERSALFAAYSQGVRKEDIEGILVTGNTPQPISPCGACRQVMSELMMPNAFVLLTNLEDKEYELTVKDLLPYAFTEGDLTNE